VASADEADGSDAIDPTRQAWFMSVPAVLGRDRLWLYDAALGVLVAVDTKTVNAVVHAWLGVPTAPPPSAVDPGELVISTDGSEAATLHVTPDSVWVARGGQLIAVDPWSEGRRVLDVPAGCSDWSTDGDHFWGTGWPSGDVVEVDVRSGAQRRVSVGGHLAQVCVSGGTLWVVDRSEETLLALDTATLQPRLRAPFGGGQVVAMLAWRGGLLVMHRPDGTIVTDGVIVEASDLWWVESNGERRRILRTASDVAVALDGDRLWLGSSKEPLLVDKSDPARIAGFGRLRSTLSLDEWPDPVATLTEVTLPKAEAGRTVTASGEIFQVCAGAGRLWCQGFVRSRQAYTLTVIDPDVGVVGEVELAALDLTPYRSALPAPLLEEPETPDETLDRLPEAVLAALTRPGVRVDRRTGERMPTSALDRRFQLVDVRLEPETYDLWVIFTWSDEPGRTFGYVYTADPERSSRGTAGDVWVCLMEDLDTGIMGWGDRDEVDGVIWLSRPDDAD
jgi:hypothetical protein